MLAAYLPGRNTGFGFAKNVDDLFVRKTLFLWECPHDEDINNIGVY